MIDDRELGAVSATGIRWGAAIRGCRRKPGGDGQLEDEFFRLFVQWLKFSNLTVSRERRLIFSKLLKRLREAKPSIVSVGLYLHRAGEQVLRFGVGAVPGLQSAEPVERQRVVRRQLQNLA